MKQNFTNACNNCEECGLCKPVTTTSYQFDNEEFKNDFSKMPYNKLVTKYKDIYRNIQQSQLPYADADTPVIELPDDFYEIVRVYIDDSGYACIIKINHNRSQNLFKNLMVRRLITPNLTFDELVYALCYEMACFVINTDKSDYITRQRLIEIAENAMAADPSGFEYERPRETITNLKYVLKHNIE